MDIAILLSESISLDEVQQVLGLPHDPMFAVIHGQFIIGQAEANDAHFPAACFQNCKRQGGNTAFHFFNEHSVRTLAAEAPDHI
ncbi:MAG TPA: hypothetical protein VGC99_02715 [Candidatus Tectomicrobia bacterium]